jgi:hypothetical protein
VRRRAETHIWASWNKDRRLLQQLDEKERQRVWVFVAAWRLDMREVVRSLSVRFRIFVRLGWSLLDVWRFDPAQ